MTGNTAEETSSGGGIILPRDLRCRCRCITTTRRLPTTLSSATTRTYWISISSTRFTLGSKFERNEFTGFEIEPNARLLWNLTPNQSIWTAVSRAVRTPALTEEGLRLNSAVIPPGAPSNPTPFPAVIAVFGSHQFNSEDLLAYELGYRVQATSNLSLDIATFYNNYSNLRTAEPGAPFVEGSPAPTDIVIPF